jgi:hypothetical protein
VAAIRRVAEMQFVGKRDEETQLLQAWQHDLDIQKIDYCEKNNSFQKYYKARHIRLADNAS